MKWEYKLVTASSIVAIERFIAKRNGKKPDIDSIQDVLNKWGEEGWELVAVNLERESVYAYFKRPK